MGSLMKGQATPFDVGYVYIVDAEDEPEDPEDAILSERYQKQRRIKRLFETHFPYDVHLVRFPPRTKPDHVLDYFDKEVKKMKRGELLIIYYNGEAGGNGEDYSWKFYGFPTKEVDAYTLIYNLTRGDVDCMMILDCYISDRFHDKWERNDPNGANFEIISSGQPLQNTDGKRVHGDPGDFTRNFIKKLDSFVKLIDVPHKKGGYQGYMALKSIPQLLANVSKLSANPRRIWISKPDSQKRKAKLELRGEDIPTVERFVLDPKDIRQALQTGLPKTARFFAKCIQAGSAIGSSKLIEMEGEEDEDEGYDELGE